MEAKDLKIGNIVLDSSGYPCVVEEIKRDNDNIIKEKGEYRLFVKLSERVTLEDLLENFFPIFIREEILLKCGFLQTSEYSLSNNILTYNLSQGIFYIGNKPMYEMECKYLHQLQNLYKELTGQELFIDLIIKPAKNNQLWD